MCVYPQGCPFPITPFRLSPFIHFFAQIPGPFVPLSVPFITRATGTLVKLHVVNTPTNPDGEGEGFGEETR